MSCQFDRSQGFDPARIRSGSCVAWRVNAVFAMGSDLADSKAWSNRGVG